MSPEINISGLSFRAISPDTSFEIYTLANGVRLIHQQVDSAVAYCALMINAGSRDELVHETGVAHLAEHLLFKGTHKRKAHHILSRLENVGGDLNAYTTKEDTCIHAAFLEEYYARTLELFSDIVFGNKISQKAFNLERNVVVDEIKSCKDNPSELIFDDFDHLLFPDHTLGNNTLGTERSVGKLNKTVVEQFIRRNYCTDQIVLSSVGKISFRRLVYFAEKYFGEIPFNSQKILRVVPVVHPFFDKTVNKRGHQSHCILGTTCDSSDRNFRVAMAMLANLLGGPGMNTRLNMSMRERNGWVYHVEASYVPYSDIGTFNIYFGTDKINLERCVTQVERELANLKKKALTGMQMKRLQQQVAGQIAIASDSNEARMLSAAKSLLMFDRIDSIRDMIMQVHDMKPEYLRDVANQVFKRLSRLTYI